MKIKCFILPLLICLGFSSEIHAQITRVFQLSSQPDCLPVNVSSFDNGSANGFYFSNQDNSLHFPLFNAGNEALIINNIGQTVWKGSALTGSIPFNKEILTPGLYYALLVENENRKITKFIIH